ncbi:MAG: precorrin-8X methylmutase [Clostridia bacterium]|nr:precorrin-8X methylmutase [Clostridia bacterium]
MRMAFKEVKPADIEKKSFEIITEELREMGKTVDPRYEHIVKRCIHTSADFEYADSLYFSEDVDSKISEAIKQGACIVTDTAMARSGINKKTIEYFGGQVLCFIADPTVAEEAKERGLTRSYVSMERASKLDRPVIVAVGNAPTALASICRLHEEGRFDPVAVIGVPVGFVNVVEAKEMLMETDIPCIVARGRKGGSNIAACIINAIQYRIRREA